MNDKYFVKLYMCGMGLAAFFLGAWWGLTYGQYSYISKYNIIAFIIGILILLITIIIGQKRFDIIFQSDHTDKEPEPPAPSR